MPDHSQWFACKREKTKFWTCGLNRSIYACYILFLLYRWMSFLSLCIFLFFFCSFWAISIMYYTVTSLPSEGSWISYQSSWSSRDRFRARKLSLRLSGRGGFLPLRNRTARALIFLQRSNICKRQCKYYGLKFSNSRNLGQIINLYRWRFYLSNTLATLTTSL